MTFFNKHHSEEAKTKISKALKRNPGKSCSEEKRQKISEALKGRKLSKEHCERIRNASLGRIFTKETRKKLSESQKGRKGYFLGKIHSTATRFKMSELRKGIIFLPEHIKKLSESHKGIHPSIETRKKLSKCHVGEKSPNWKGGITKEVQKIRHSIEIRLWREAVFARDNWTCRECEGKMSGLLNAHHIKSFSEYPELRVAIDNGITLCKKCHKKIHQKS